MAAAGRKEGRYQDRKRGWTGEGKAKLCVAVVVSFLPFSHLGFLRPLFFTLNWSSVLLPTSPHLTSPQSSSTHTRTLLPPPPLSCRLGNLGLRSSSLPPSPACVLFPIPRRRCSQVLSTENFTSSPSLLLFLSSSVPDGTNPTV